MTTRLLKAIAVGTFSVAATLTPLLSLAQEVPSPTMSLEGSPDWLIKSMARERSGLKALPVRIPDRKFSTKLIGKSHTELQNIGDGWYLTSDIGSDTPMECWVFTSDVDPATTVNNIAELSMTNTSQQYGEIGSRFVYYVDAGAIGNYPYLAYEKMYVMGEAPNASIGFIKVRISKWDGMHLACSHNLPGYRETFAKGFEQFVLEATAEPDGKSPFLREIIRNSIGQQAIGFIEIAYTNQDDGNLLVSRQSATMMPVDASTIATEDSYDIAYWAPDDTLITRSAAQASNGELDIDLKLIPNESGGYAVSGTFQEKPIAVEIADSELAKSDIFQMLEMQRLIKDPSRDSITTNVWEPSADPTSFIPSTFAFDSDGRDDLLGTVTLGPIGMKIQIDENGSLKTGDMDIGAATMHIERIRAIGEYPKLEIDD